MIATIKVNQYQGLVMCLLFNGNQFKIDWLDYGNFPKSWHKLNIAHKNHIQI